MVITCRNIANSLQSKNTTILPLHFITLSFIIDIINAEHSTLYAINIIYYKIKKLTFKHCAGV